MARFKLKKEEEAAAAAAGGTAKATADTASASAGTVNPAAQRKPKGKPAVKGPKAAGTQAQADGPAKQVVMELCL